MSDKENFITGVVVFCIYSLITFLCIISYLKRELYIFQTCDYKISGYVWQIPKNYTRYIFPALLCAGQFIMLATKYKEIYYNETLSLLFLAGNIIIALVNRPFRKMLENNILTRKIMIIFFILVAVIFRISVLWGYDATFCKCGMDIISYWFCNIIPFMVVNSALYLTPVIICLSGIPFQNNKRRF